jgi:hypothetical protein
VQSPAGKEITRYFYEGNRVVLELDASGTITAHNTYGIKYPSGEDILTNKISHKKDDFFLGTIM